MEVNKIISHALQSMPPSKRQKAFAKDTSKLIHMGLNENNYGMSPKAVAALEDSMAGSHFYPDFAAVLLKQKVAEQQIAIQSAQIDQKKAQIEYDAAAEKQEKGQELAKIDGVVTKVAASVESLEKNEPYLVVQGSGGVMVQGTVSEMNLDKLTVGATVTVNSWDTGEMLTAEVTEIDKTPTSYTNQNGSENPNNSAYPLSLIHI